MPTGNTPGHSRGFTYLAVLLAIAIIGTTLASTGVVWHTLQQREREAELLFVGDHLRAAIGQYYNHMPLKEFPEHLEDLLRDPRDVGTTRHLRKLYHDPITGSVEWGLIKDTHERIVGVYSRSEDRPIKQHNFPAADQGFEDRETYAQWQFIYQPKVKRKIKSAAAVVSPASGPAPTPAGTKP